MDVYFAFATVQRRADILPVFVGPAWTGVSCVCLAALSIVFGALNYVPARDHGEDGLDTCDAEFLFINGFADAFEMFHVVLAVSALVGVGLLGEDEAFALVHAQSEDRDAEHSGDSADGVDRGVHLRLLLVLL